jgi:putative heme-binding domain-containing protein
VQSVWGKVRDTPAELNSLIDRMRGELAARPGSFEHGQKVFEFQCSKCHKFEGKGHEVGPALDGAGRDIEYLLINILDPNRVVGAPYFLRVVSLKNGRVETGLLLAEDESTLTLKGENDAQKVIAKKDIEELSVQEKSLMPEGLANAMTVQDFRDLVRYLMIDPFLTTVKVAGPFGAPPDWAAIPPEVGGNTPAMQPVVGVSGRIQLPPSNELATAYIRGAVIAPASVRSRLSVATPHPVKIWVNGKAVYEEKSGAAAGARTVDVALIPGKNQIDIAVRYLGKSETVFARFIDPERRLRYAEPPGR